MRFIGNKEKLVDSIYQKVLSVGIKDGVFCDFFAGTSNVGRYFKGKGFDIVSSDLLYFSYVLQKAYIENNVEPKFKKLLNTIQTNSNTLLPSPLYLIKDYLNKLNGIEGFIYNNYTEEGTLKKKYQRKYFIGENGKKIDAIRQKIEEWKDKKLINNKEYFILLAALIESVPFYANISGVYAAFLKDYDPRSLKPFQIRAINFFSGKGKHKVYNKDSMELINDLDVDVLYLDPPYNARQYAPNYHLLETISLYDNPKIKGITGLREYDDKKSDFCNKNNALKALNDIASKSKYKCLILSYNSEGIMPQKEIVSILEKYGKVKIENIDYLRFKSNNNGQSKHRKIIQEQLYILT